MKKKKSYVHSHTRSQSVIYCDNKNTVVKIKLYCIDIKSTHNHNNDGAIQSTNLPRRPPYPQCVCEMGSSLLQI